MSILKRKFAEINVSPDMNITQYIKSQMSTWDPIYMYNCLYQLQMTLINKIWHDCNNIR